MKSKDRKSHWFQPVILLRLVTVILGVVVIGLVVDVVVPVPLLGLLLIEVLLLVQ